MTPCADGARLGGKLALAGATGALLLALGACSRQGRARDLGAGAASSPVASTRAASSIAPPSDTADDLVPPSAPEPPACGDPGDVTIIVSPERPIRGEPLRVVAVTDARVDARLAVAPTPRTRSPSGGAASADAGSPAPLAASDRAQGGPPYFWIAQVDAPAAGSIRATLARSDACSGTVLAAKDTRVAVYPLPPSAPPRTALWTTRRAWSRSTENLYSAWIQHLFDAPLEAQPSWGALHEVLRDRSRNFLFGHTGAPDDEQSIVIRPDCADLPYFLRAYFSFELGLPFGWSRCSRGEDGRPPHCADFATNEDPFPDVDGKPQPLPSWANPDRDRDGGPWEKNVKRLGELFRTSLADAAQSGSGRTPADDEDGDYYPVAVSVETLRPGTIFADPYGHVLVVAARIPQTASAAGVLLAVDGQPDGTVARKRFWRGNFLFAVDPSLGSAGFKRFRPVVRDRATGHLMHVKNADVPDFSATDQYAGGVEGFYDKIEDVLSPAPLRPVQALLETIQALDEQVRTRVLSVDNGRKFLLGHPPAVDMPDGEKIFETTGSWEDFSTPSRDLRLLIAIDVVRAMPGRFARRPERYATKPGESVDQVRARLEATLATQLRERKVKYTRSDGSEWELSLEDVVDREQALEMAYNPNDCVEARWGAAAGSVEASTCGAHAPDVQLAKMATYREWFHDRRRPPR